MTSPPTIWTIGHSTHPAETFLQGLKNFEIRLLADVRHYPGSRRHPQFNQDQLQQSLAQAGIGYLHLPGLGGRRQPEPGSVNTRWRNAGFRGYADHMATGIFLQSMDVLQERARAERTVYMCSEAVWWSCHRSLMSDWLKVRGWTVLHIMTESKAVEHPWTGAARIVNGQLRYDDPNLFEPG